MGGMIPLSDASRRPRRFAAVTATIIVVNALVFLLELIGGDAFVKQWSVVPADIVAGRRAGIDRRNFALPARVGAALRTSLSRAQTELRF